VSEHHEIVNRGSEGNDRSASLSCEDSHVEELNTSKDYKVFDQVDSMHRVMTDDELIKSIFS